MVTGSRFSWDQLETVIAGADAPVAIRLDGEIVVHLFYEPDEARLGLRVPAGQTELRPSPLAQITVSRRRIGGVEVVEIATRAPVLFPYFHGFATSVADRVQIDGLDANVAVNECTERWQDLLRLVGRLGPEREVGLLGELWLLSRLIDGLGPRDALAAWTGPTRAPHDFRFGIHEIEVKSTRGEHRIHVISSDTQLIASTGFQLSLLSLQFTAAGPGQGSSLGQEVAEVRAKLADVGLRRQFDGTLSAAYGLDPLDLSAYSARLKLRSDAYLVPVDDSFPRLVLRDVVDAGKLARISDVQYRVDVEGLGHPAGTEPFSMVLGAIHDAPR